LAALINYETKHHLSFTKEKGRDKGIYGFTNQYEMVSEAFSNPDFSKILNAIPVNSKQKVTDTNNILTRLLDAVLTALNKLGFKINKGSVLGHLSQYISDLEKLSEKKEVTVEELQSRNIQLSKDTPGKRITNLWGRISKFKSVTSQETLKTAIDKLNEVLPEAKQITEQETTQLLTKFKKANIETSRGRLIKSMGERTNPNRFSTQTGVKNPKGKIVPVETKLNYLVPIHRALTSEYTDKELDTARGRLAELQAKQVSHIAQIGEQSETINGLTEQEQIEFDVLRFKLHSKASLAELRLLNKEISNIITKGKTIRKEKNDARRKKLDDRRIKLLNITVGREGSTETDFIPEIGTPAYNKGRRDNKAWLKQFKNRINTFVNSLDSFTPIMAILGRKEKGAGFHQTSYNKEFSDRQLEANNARAVGMEKTSNIVWSKFINTFIGEEVDLTSQKTKLAVGKQELEIKTENQKIIYFPETIDKEGVVIQEEEKTLEMSPEQIMDKWMKMQDPTSKGNFKGAKWGESFKSVINNWMDAHPKHKEYANWLLDDFYPMYGERINEVYSKNYDHELPLIAKYSPRLLDYFNEARTNTEQGVQLEDHDPIANLIYSALMTRIRSHQPLHVKGGAISLLDRHIRQSEHFMAYDSFLSEFKSFAYHPETRKTLEYKYGKQMNTNLDMYINAFANGGMIKTIADKSLDKWR
ncbi:hypothetical protein LCGC14_2066120, partial [marine sediment metagenome]